MKIDKDFVDRAIDDLMISTAQASLPSNVRKDFRCSSLPFCPIRTFLDMEEFDSNFQSGFYTGIGTVVHELIQQWILFTNLRTRVWGCWKCRECSNVTGPGFLPNPFQCAECGSKKQPFYEELAVEYDGLSGHIDLIYEIAPDKFIVLDFKTTNLFKNKRWANWKNKYPASPSSPIQIGTYCMILSEKYNLNIVGYALVYVDRGQVIKNKEDYYSWIRPWNAKKTRWIKGHIDRACRNSKRLQKLQKIISESEEYNKKAEDQLKAMVKSRPCHSTEEYQDFMAYKFHPRSTGERECALKPYCVKSSKSIYQKIKQNLAE